MTNTLTTSMSKQMLNNKYFLSATFSFFAMAIKCRTRRYENGVVSDALVRIWNFRPSSWPKSVIRFLEHRSSGQLHHTIWVSTEISRFWSYPSRSVTH